MKYAVSILLFSVLWVVGCKKDGRSAEEKRLALDSLHQRLEVIDDSLDVAWKSIEASDQEKFFSLKRLLDEISYTGEYDSVVHDSLVQVIDDLQEAGLQPEDLADSESIDAYDYRTSQLIGTIDSMAIHHPKYDQYVLMGELLDDIHRLQDNLLFQRVHYDQFARSANELIDHHQDIIAEHDTTHMFHKKPLFAIE